MCRNRRVTGEIKVAYKTGYTEFRNNKNVPMPPPVGMRPMQLEAILDLKMTRDLNKTIQFSYYMDKVGSKRFLQCLTSAHLLSLFLFFLFFVSWFFCFFVLSFFFPSSSSSIPGGKTDHTLRRKAYAWNTGARSHSNKPDYWCLFKDDYFPPWLDLFEWSGRTNEGATKTSFGY